MKNLIIVIIVCYLFASCDPPPGAPLAEFEGTTIITARIINPRDSIGVNDTIRIQFEVLDTIVYNGNKVKVYYGTKDVAYCNLRLWKIDTANAGAFGIPVGSITYTPVGQLRPTNSVSFQNNGTSMKAEYCFIPRSKGVFFINQNDLGNISANNGQYYLDTYWSYGNINRNHQMLIDSAGAKANFTLYLQGAANDGREVYGFKVN